MSSSKNYTPPHKSNNKLTKKQKVLLGTLIPIALLGMCGGGLGAGYALWHKGNPGGDEPTPPTKSISASVEGSLRLGATISITLINGAIWDDVDMATGSGWNKSSATEHKYTKTNVNAAADESVTISLLGNNSLNLTIPSGYTFPNLDLPVTPTFYNIDANNVIQGFSTDFLHASTSEDNARKYLISNITGAYNTTKFCMNLSHKTITGTQYAFSPKKSSGNDNINNILPLFDKLDFFDTQWQWKDGFSGNNTFGSDDETTSCNFRNVRTLNLQGADFALNDDRPVNKNNEARTACETFRYAKLNALTSLDLVGTNFAVDASKGLGTTPTCTAYKTFEFANFSSLSSLSLYGAKFADNGMNTTPSYIYTADSTFASCIFSLLTSLNPAGAFAADGMATNTTTVYTMNGTFYSADFESLKTLDFTNAVFACGTMKTGNGAESSFSYAKFSNLKILDFGNCQLGDAQNGKNAVRTTWFEDIGNNNAWSATNQLKLSGSWGWGETSGDNPSSQLDTWFGGASGTHDWTFSKY